MLRAMPKPKDTMWHIRLSEEEARMLRDAAEMRDAKPATITREVLVRWAKRTLAA
jgi:hypothetical protein